MATSSIVVLSADYKCPTGDRNFKHCLSAASSGVDSQKAYFQDLRNATKTLQHEINLFLTQKMDEDKAAAKTYVDETVNRASSGEDEDVNEDEYGEEKEKHD